MKRNKLPPEYVKKLNEHRYVAMATEWKVSYTEEFKRMAYHEYICGKNMREIFIEAGFDIELLGKKRISRFFEHLKEKDKEKSGFKDKRKDKDLQVPLSTEAKMIKRIQDLECRNAYLEQENEFLKKIRDPEEKYDGKAGKRK